MDRPTDGRTDKAGCRVAQHATKKLQRLNTFENQVSGIGFSEKNVFKTTRIWVTNSLSFLPYVHHILYLEEGRIARQGTYQEIIKENDTFAAFVTSKIDASKDVDNDGDSGLEEDEKKIGQKKPISKELETNDVDGSLSCRYT